MMEDATLGKGSERVDAPEEWLWRTRVERLLGIVIRWATRLAGAAFVLSLFVPGARIEMAIIGTAVLLAAPFLATLSAALLFGRRGDWRLSLLAGALLVLLGVGAWLSMHGPW